MVYIFDYWLKKEKARLKTVKHNIYLCLLYALEFRTKPRVLLDLVSSLVLIRWVSNSSYIISKSLEVNTITTITILLLLHENTMGRDRGE